MPKSRPRLRRLLSDRGGFSLTELMISSAVTLIVLAETMGAFHQALRAHNSVTLLADSNQALRAGTAFMVRDILQTGNGIPTGGIPIPSGQGSEPVNRPSPPGLAYSFDEDLGVLPALSTGASLGPQVSGTTTDLITVLYLDNRLALEEYPLTSIAADGSSATVDARTSIADPDTAIVTGDLFVFSNALGYALQEVTRTLDQQVFFETTDSSNLNQRDAASGTLLQLKTDPSSYPPTYAFRVRMITYYVDATTDPTAPRLVRQENYRAPRAMAGAVDGLRLTYDLVDGTDHVTGVAEPVTPNTPHQIRKVNIQLGVRSEARSSDSQAYTHGTVSTQVSLRSLAYVDRYE